MKRLNESVSQPLEDVPVHLSTGMEESAGQLSYNHHSPTLAGSKHHHNMARNLLRGQQPGN